MAAVPLLPTTGPEKLPPILQLNDPETVARLNPRFPVVVTVALILSNCTKVPALTIPLALYDISPATAVGDLLKSI